MDNLGRASQAHSYYQQSMERVKNTPQPAGQKFPIGCRVMIAHDLGPSMSHFPAGLPATVEYVYAHAYGGDDVTQYSLLVDGKGSRSWYHESQLTKLD